METNKTMTHVSSEPLILAAFSDMPSCLYVNVDEWWQLRFVLGCFLTKSLLYAGAYKYLTIQIFVEFITEKDSGTVFLLKQDSEQQQLPPHNAVILCNPWKILYINIWMLMSYLSLPFSYNQQRIIIQKSIQL